MRFCPNLSDPEVASKFNAILNDPDLGRLEAMREVAEAQLQNRPMGSPEEVKAKLERRSKGKTREEQQERINAEKEEIARVSNDPTFNDPDSLTGIPFLWNPINSKSGSLKAQDNTRALEIVSKLSNQTGIDYHIVSPEEAVEITKNAKNPYEISKGPAFFYGGAVYFIQGALTTNLAFHEFAHPIIRSIQASNPLLFQKLFDEALAADPTLLEEAYNEYSDLRESISNTVDPVEKQALEEKYKKIVAEEVLVKALTKQAELARKNLEPSTGLKNFFKNLLFAIRQSLRKLFGSKVKVSKLDGNTTMAGLADMLLQGDQFEINTELVTEEDLVAYFEDQSKYIEDLKNVFNQGNNQALMEIIKDVYEQAMRQINLLQKKMAYGDIADLLVDEFDRGDLQEIRKNLSKYANLLDEKAEQRIEDLENTGNQVLALVGTMMRLDVVMNKIELHLRELKNEPGNRDNVHKAYYYTHIINHWDTIVQNAKKIMLKEGADPNSPIINLLDTILTRVNTATEHINEINTFGVADVLWEQWELLGQRAEELFKDQIRRYKERGASPSLITKKFVEFYGMPEAEYEEYLKLKERKAKGEKLGYEEQKKFEIMQKATTDALHMTKEKIEAKLRGEGRDTNWANAYLEGYLYSTDPVIGGFATFYRDNMIEMESRAQTRYNEIISELKPALKEAGITNFRNIGQLGEQIGFIDKIGHFNKESGIFETKEIRTLLNPYKDYRVDIDKYNHEIRELQKIYNRTGSSEDKLNLITKIHEKKKHMRQYFHQQYVDEYYDDTNLVKDDNDNVGKLAAQARDEIFERMREINHPMMTEYDILKTADEMDALWKEYRLLYSLYYPDGTKKTNSFTDKDGETIVTNDLAIAQRLQEHREKSRKYFEWKERPGAFQNALKNFETETYQKLKDLKLVPGTEEFQDQFDSLREQWIERNTRIVIKPEFYQERARILKRVKEITSKLPSSIANEVDFSERWKTILDVVSGYRDTDGQPVGSSLTAGRRKIVKESQEAMEAAKKMWAGYSGLTVEEMDRLVELASYKLQKKRFTKSEADEYIELVKKQKAEGLSESEKKELTGLFAQLRELQRKDPTDYYLDSVNHWLERLDTKVVYAATGIKEFTAANIQMLYAEDTLDKLFQISPEFKKWFTANHIQTEKWDATLKEKVPTWERLYVWNVIKPNDPSYYETTEVPNQDGTVTTVKGLPKLKYYVRRVKNEYRTGYNPNTGEVKPIVGVHRDNKNSWEDGWLPKQIEGSPYINERYFELKNADPESKDGKLFKVLQVITKHHLKTQENLGKRSKLYMDFPRFEKSNLEVLQTKKLRGIAKEKTGALQLMFGRLKDWWRGRARSEAGEEYNWNDENQLVRADAFDDQIDNIPIQGLYNLNVNETSTDIITSMFRYLYGAEHQKQLIKMNPVAKALKSILNNPDNVLKETNKINLANFVNRGQVTYVNKRGKYVRQQAFNNFYERNFNKVVATGWLSDNNFLQSLQKALFGRASFSFFAFNIPSAIKNQMGAKFQALIEASAGENVSFASLALGEKWAYQYMFKLSFGDAYAKGQKSLMHQIGEVFDPVQDRFKEKFGESVTRSVLKDAPTTGWFYNFRKWTELQASMQIFAGMMYKKKIPMGDKMINYMDAWTLDDKGRVTLKEGIDPTWGITYDEEGNPIVGKEFKLFRGRIQAVMTSLQGAYASFDQPEAQRYILFRFISYLRRYFTTMMLQRFGFRRWNPGYGEIDEGYYIQGAKAIWSAVSRLNLANISREDRKAVMKIVTEMGLLMILGFVVSAIFGYDDDDEERFEKLRQKSGPLGLFGVAESDYEFSLPGFLELHALNLVMQVRAENEQFLPLPGYGLENLLSMTDLKSIVFGPTTDTYKMIVDDMINIFEGSDRQFYKRRVGPYEWQQKGGSKLWTHVAKAFGMTGSSIDPAQAITNLIKAKNLSRAR